MRELDYYLRQEGINTTTAFESEEFYQRMLKKYDMDDPKQRDLFNKTVYEARRGNKYCFRMNTGKLKLCTTHSFKGWEITNLIVLLHEDSDNPDDKKEHIPELLYTALTRCREHLLILNAGCEEYDEFFRSVLEYEEIEMN